MSEQPKYETKCLICGKAFRAPAVGMPEGNNANPRSAKVIDALVSHLYQVHRKPEGSAEPKESDIIVSAGQQFMGWLALRNFTTEDPGLVFGMHVLRSSIHRLSAGRDFSDDQIKTRAADILSPFALNDDVKTAVIDAMLELRDAIVEQGKYALRPPPAAQSEETAAVTL